MQAASACGRPTLRPSRRQALEVEAVWSQVISHQTPRVGLVADSGRIRYRGPAEVHVSLRNPQVELVPCRRHQTGPTLVDTSKTMEGGTST